MSIGIGRRAIAERSQIWMRSRIDFVVAYERGTEFVLTANRRAKISQSLGSLLANHFLTSSSTSRHQRHRMLDA